MLSGNSRDRYATFSGGQPESYVLSALRGVYDRTPAGLLLVDHPSREHGPESSVCTTWFVMPEASPLDVIRVMYLMERVFVPVVGVVTLPRRSRSRHPVISAWLRGVGPSVRGGCWATRRIGGRGCGPFSERAWGLAPRWSDSTLANMTRDGTMTYAAAGVDLKAGDKVVEQIAHHVRRTHSPRVLGEFGGFAGCFRLDYEEALFRRHFRDPVLVTCTDGVGSKVLLASKLKIFDTVGQDCVGMNVNDLVVGGAEPLFFLDYIGIHRDAPKRVAEIVKGVADGCRLAGCALISGETAALPGLYAKDHFDLVGFTVGVCERHRLIDGSRIVRGDIILGLASNGMHSNGYTLVQAILRRCRLDLDRIYPDVDEHISLGKVLLTPTRIYVHSVMAAIRKYRVKLPIRGMAHITGGGLPGNVNRVLGSHLNANIRCRNWEVPPIFRFLQAHGHVEDQEMYRVFNMGIGYVMIVRPYFADSIQHLLRSRGEKVQVIGRIGRGTGRVVLRP